MDYKNVEDWLAKTSYDTQLCLCHFFKFSDYDIPLPISGELHLWYDLEQAWFDRRLTTSFESRLVTNTKGRRNNGS
jgi:hypothetical protein